MQILRDSYALHAQSNRLPNGSEVAVGKIAIVFYDNQNPILYTKDFNGRILEIGKGVSKLEELEDVDLSNAREGSFLIKQGDKYITSSFLGNLGFLSDVELQSPVETNQYLRYNSLLESFTNYYPSYYLDEITNVNVADSGDVSASLAQNNHVLYYNHDLGGFYTRPRTNLINELADVEINLQNDEFQILALGNDGIWRNSNLRIEFDPSPTLSNDLDVQGNTLINSSYKSNSLDCNDFTVELNYSEGDYWVLYGVPVETINQCIVNINFNTKPNTTSVLMLEIRQDTGSIVLGNLTNVKYEDGELFQLSGAGKTDLITITQVNTQVGLEPAEIVTYITASALNLSTLGQGGVPSYRYDKNRYPFTQQFSLPNRYDDYFDYVESLLTFEPEVSTGKTWIDDKACRVDINNTIIPTTVITTGIQVSSNKFSLGIEDFVIKLDRGIPAHLTTINSVNNDHTYIIAQFGSTVELNSDFTLELFLNYDLNQFKEDSTDIEDYHYLFSNETITTTNELHVRYIPTFSTTGQNTKLELKVGNSQVALENGYTYFYNKSTDFFTHIALQRVGGEVQLYIDGVIQTIPSIINTDTFLIDSYKAALNGNISTIRLTNSIARYSPNLINVPNLRFGLVGGANDILDRQVFDSFLWLDREFEQEIFAYGG